MDGVGCRSVRGAAQRGPVAGAADVFVAGPAIRPRPIAGTVPCPAQAGIDLFPVVGALEVRKGKAAACVVAVVDVVIVVEGPRQVRWRLPRPEAGG